MSQQIVLMDFDEQKLNLSDKEAKISVLDYSQKNQQKIQQNQIQDQQQNLQKFVLNLYQETLKRTQAENLEIRNKLILSQVELVQRDNEINLLRNQSDFVKDDKDKLQAKVKALELYASDLQRKLDHCLKEISDQTKELEEYKISDIGRRLLILNNEISQMRKILSFKDDENINLKKQINQLISNTSSQNSNHHLQILEQQSKEISIMKKQLLEHENRNNMCHKKWSSLLQENLQKEEKIRGLKLQLEKQIENIQCLYSQSDKRVQEFNKKIRQIIEDDGEQQQKQAALFLYDQITFIQKERELFAVENEDLHTKIQEMIYQIQYLKQDAESQDYKGNSTDITGLIQALRQRVEELSDLVNEFKQRDNVDELVQATELIGVLEKSQLNLKQNNDQLQMQLLNIQSQTNVRSEESAVEFFSKLMQEKDQKLYLAVQQIESLKTKDRHREFEQDNLKQKVNLLTHTQQQQQTLLPQQQLQNKQKTFYDPEQFNNKRVEEAFQSLDLQI